MDELREEVQLLSDSEWSSFLAWVVTTEKQRRESLPVVTQAQAELVTQLQDAGKLEKPEAVTEEEAVDKPDDVPEWQDPGTDHSKMYHYGDVVRFDGALIRSTHQGLNHWAPGTLGLDGRIWEKVSPDPAVTEDAEPDVPEEEEVEASSPEVSEFVQPTRAEDSYQIGDLVKFNGDVYESVIAANVWSPQDYPRGWKKVSVNV